MSRKIEEKNEAVVVKVNARREGELAMASEQSAWAPPPHFTP
jgi:hypothetical protein